MWHYLIVLVVIGTFVSLPRAYSVDDCDSFVASFGNDTGNGTREAPYLWIEQAIETISCQDGQDCVVCIGGNISLGYHDGVTRVLWGRKNRLVLRGFNWLPTQLGKPQLFGLESNFSGDFSITLERVTVLQSLRWVFNLETATSVNVTASECSLSWFSNFFTLPAEIHITDSTLTESFNFCFQATESNGTSTYIKSSKIECTLGYRGRNIVIRDSTFEDAYIGGPFNNPKVVEIHNSVQNCHVTHTDCLSFGSKDEDLSILLVNNTFTRTNKTANMLTVETYDKTKWSLTLQENNFMCKPFNSQFTLVGGFWKQNYTTISLVNQTIPEACQSNCPLGMASYDRVYACSDCSFGFYANSSDASMCYACPIGTKGPGHRNINCTDCAPGSYSNTTGAYLCEYCTNNTYQNMPGQAQCLVCPSGKPLDQHVNCAPCDVGYIPQDDECVACPWYFTTNIGDLECKKPTLYAILAGVGGGVVVFVILMITFICCCCFCSKKQSYETVN